MSVELTGEGYLVATEKVLTATEVNEYKKMLRLPVCHLPVMLVPKLSPTPTGRIRVVPAVFSV